VASDRRVLLGETGEYEPLCRECYKKAIAADASQAMDTDADGAK
jgi:thymidine kinase